MQQAILVKQPTGNFFKDIFSVKSWILFAVFVFIYIFSNYFLRDAILTDEVYYNSFADQLSGDNIRSVMDMQNKVGFISYLVIPFVLIIKIATVAACIFVGMLLTGNEKNISFTQLVKIVTFAEVAFVISSLLRLIILTLFHPVNTLADLQAFAPLSLYSLFSASAIPAYLVYPLQTISVFEIGYILLLSAGIQYYLKNSFQKSATIVLSSYGIGLFCWIAFITFLRLNSSAA